MKTLNMKLILSALGIVAMLTSPAFAQRPQRQASHQTTTQYQMSQGNEVESAGRVIGADPDPQIRSELSRDAGQSLGGY